MAETFDSITIDAKIKAPVEKVWDYWTRPEHIVNWNQASEDWHTTQAVNDLKIDGRFSSRMEAKDGSEGFDFGGTYTQVHEYHLIAYTLDDGRKVEVVFEEVDGHTKITQTFDAEKVNPLEVQEAGWQSILNNFKEYVETLEA